MASVTIGINGMSCGHCVAAVKRALGSIPGVSITTVAVGHADVAYDATTANVPTILTAVEEAGYPAHATGRVSS